MKQSNIYCTIVAVSLLFFGSCHKQISFHTSSESYSIQQAQSFFKDSIEGLVTPATVGTRQAASKTLAWDEAKTITWPVRPAVLVPIRYQKRLYVNSAFESDYLVDLSKVTNLLIYADSSNCRHAIIITNLPDSAFLSGHSITYTGLMFIEDWQGNSISKYKYLRSGQVLKQTDPDPKTGISTKESLNQKQVSTVIMTCTEIDGYNYSPDDPSGGFSWSESGGCSTTYIPNGFPSLAGATSPPPTINFGPIIASHIILPGPTQIIANIAAYFQCFTNSSAIDHTYSVTLCVDQPRPGTREPWAITAGGPGGTINQGNIINAGHAFLIFNENSSGTVINRNVGFFPSSLITPLNPQSQGVLSNDETHGYNISLTINLTNDQFFAMLNYVSIGNNAGYYYDLNSNNCTTFALHALAAGGVSISSKQGVWPDGAGYDPGDLGEDIRQMVIRSTMSRSLASSSHPNTGNCN